MAEKKYGVDKAQAINKNIVMYKAYLKKLGLEPSLIDNFEKETLMDPETTKGLIDSFFKHMTGEKPPKIKMSGLLRESGHVAKTDAELAAITEHDVVNRKKTAENKKKSGQYLNNLTSRKESPLSGEQNKAFSEGFNKKKSEGGRIIPVTPVPDPGHNPYAVPQPDEPIDILGAIKRMFSSKVNTAAKKSKESQAGTKFDPVKKRQAERTTR